MVLLQSAVPGSTREMMLPLSGLQRPSASGSMGNYWETADSGHTQNPFEHTQKTLQTCMQLTYEHKQTHGQASAKSHMHTVEFTSRTKCIAVARTADGTLMAKKHWSQSYRL